MKTKDMVLITDMQTPERKKLYSDYHVLKERSRALSVAKANTMHILGITTEVQNRQLSLAQTHDDSRVDR